MKYLLLISGLLLAITTTAQQKETQGETPPPPPKGTIFNYTEQQPVPGFDVPSYLQGSLHYPDSAMNNNIQGRVVVKFVVNEDGSVSDVAILKGIGGGCDEEAARVVSQMPRWKPGKQNGTAVKVYFTLPIQFKIEDEPRKGKRK